VVAHAPEQAEALVVAVQAPDVARALQRPGQGVVEPEVRPVDRGGLLHPSLLEQQCAVGVPRRLHPAPRLVARQPVVQLDGAAQVGERLLDVALPVFELAVEHGRSDGQDVLAGVVENRPRLRHPRVPGTDELALDLRLRDVATRR
jgi:hypothetical protein